MSSSPPGEREPGGEIPGQSLELLLPGMTVDLLDEMSVMGQVSQENVVALAVRNARLAVVGDEDGVLLHGTRPGWFKMDTHRYLTESWLETGGYWRLYGPKKSRTITVDQSVIDDIAAIRSGLEGEQFMYLDPNPDETTHDTWGGELDVAIAMFHARFEWEQINGWFALYRRDPPAYEQLPVLFESFDATPSHVSE